MKKNTKQRPNGEIRPEYDFSSMKGGIRGKYYEQYRRGSNVVLLDPDIAKAFPTEGAVNEALRGILSATHSVRRTGELSGRAMRATSKGHKRAGRS
jgi:hypothetical protein